MKKLCLIALLIPSLSFGATAEQYAEKALVELQTISTSWKTVKDSKSAKASVKVCKVQSAKLLVLANELLKLKRPDNAQRSRIHKNRELAIRKIGREMATTFAVLKSNPNVMPILAKGLQEIEKEMLTSQQVFDLYFKPDPVKTK